MNTKDVEACGWSREMPVIESRVTHTHTPHKHTTRTTPQTTMSVNPNIPANHMNTKNVEGCGIEQGDGVGEIPLSDEY